MTLMAVALWALQVPPFRVPDGWEVERAAGPPLVERPMLAAFDDRGRLYVADSAGVNLKGAELLKDPPHRIRVLEDTDGDGRFDASRVFADRLVFPQGLLWHDGAVFTVSPPSLWRLEDTDGDGVCDRRIPLLNGFANTGVADDVHGCCLGPDGRLYFLPGRMPHDLKLPDGTPLRKAVGPWLMRCRPDGSDMEFVCGAQGNPVEVDWLPEGDFFISGTFWAPERFGGGLRDALIHGVEGGEYAVRDRAYTDRIRTGDFLPALVPMTATAPSGLAVLQSGDLLATYFNTHAVQRHVLARDGASFRATTEPFVVSDNADFHPTDVLEDADGSILVVDTGGWFRIGCPTSQIAKPDVLGGIWRLRRKGAPRIENPRGLGEAARIDDPRWAVRRRAMHEIAERGDVEVVRRISTTDAVWTLARIETAGARAVLRERLKDPSASIRQSAAAALGLQRDREAVAALSALVVSDTPAVRRESATALGRIGDPMAAVALLDALREGPDRFLEHALIYALVRLGAREPLVEALSERAIRRPALIALDQMGALRPELVTPLLDPADPALQQAALDILTARGWAREVLAFVRNSLASSAPADLRGIVVAFAREPALQDLVARALRRDATPAEVRIGLLEAITGAPMPPTWIAETRWALDHPDPRVARQAVAALRAAGTSEADPALVALAADARRPLELRLEALSAQSGPLPAPLVDLLVEHLDGRHPPLIRLTAAEALGRAALDDKQLHALTAAVEKAGPLEAPRLLRAYRGVKGKTAARLLAALQASPGTAALTADALRTAVAGLPDDHALLKRLSADAEAQKAKLESLKDALSGGDVRRGREVFLGRTAGCTACHAVAGQGGRVGPDLTKIGAIRNARDLLEAVVFPSATFARGYEPVAVRTRDGSVIDGVIARESPDAIVIMTADRVEKRVPREAVEALRESRISIMPQGLDGQLTRDELRDLIAYLESLR